MPIIVHLDVMLARRKIRSKDLAQKVGLTEANLSLRCQPGDLLSYLPGNLPPSEEMAAEI
jgi:putative transcriptional regulator